MNNTYELIPVASITIDPERYQARLEGLDSEHVDCLVDSYNPQSTKEAIQVVLTDSGQYILTDGFHRCAAIKKGELATTVMAEVVLGDAGKAFILSRAANFKNGKNLSPLDTRRSIEDLLELAPSFNYDPKKVTDYLTSVNVPSRTASRYTVELRNSIIEQRNRKIIEMRDEGCTNKAISLEVGFNERTISRIIKEVTKKTAVQNVSMYDDGPMIPVWDEGVCFDEWSEAINQRKEEEANDPKAWLKPILAKEKQERLITSKQYEGVILAASDDEPWFDKAANRIRERANGCLFKVKSIDEVIKRGFDAIYVEPYRGEVIGMPLGHKDALAASIWKSVFNTEYVPEDDCIDTACFDAQSIVVKDKLRLDITEYGYYDIKEANGLPQNCTGTNAPPCPVLKKLREQVWQDIEVLFCMLDGARESGELSYKQIAEALPWNFYSSEETVHSASWRSYRATPNFLLAVRFLEGMDKPFLCTGKGYEEYEVTETMPSAVPIMIPDNYLGQPASSKNIAEQISKLSHRWAFLMQNFDEGYSNVYRWHVMGHGDRYRSVLMLKDMLVRVEQFARKAPEYQRIEKVLGIDKETIAKRPILRKAPKPKLQTHNSRNRKSTIEERKSGKKKFETVESVADSME